MKDKYTKYRILTLFLLILTPFLFSYMIVIINNLDRYKMSFGIFTISLSYISLFILLICLLILIKNKKLFKTKNKYKKIAVLSFAAFYIFEIFGATKLLYYNDEFKKSFITSSLYSDNLNGLLDTLYGKDIKKQYEENKEEELPNINDYNNSYKTYLNKYEEEILNHEENQKYKIIKIEGTAIGSDYHYEGYMAVVYDPSLVHVAKSSGAGTEEGSFGEILTDISRKNNAIIAINAGGFYDPNWDSNGGIPHGDVIIDGELKSSYIRGIDSGGIIGFDYNNKLILKKMTTEELLNSNIRDAVDYGPYLIVDGVNLFKNVDYYTWACARTAIGQREDGIVLMLVIDGLQSHSKGASYADMAAIMEKYGAVNAANLDGGTSTAMTLNHEYINSPWNGNQRTYRWLPNAFIVKED